MTKSNLIKTSLTCFLALNLAHSNLNASYLNLDKSSHKTIQEQNLKKYLALCDDIVQLHSYYSLIMLKEQDFFKLKNTENIQEKQRLRKYLKELDKVISTAKKRIDLKQDQSLKKADLKVYYSSIALKNILESLLDNDFMNLMGGFETSILKDFDIIEFGKGVEEANKALRA
ncbi:hypothetical protein DMB92_05240 [Campylobacter sp. MIT 99-7217]|uniref:hypothetical protein n=1 Tax=Campylobacter sp. MIT 99-7217 TaxID=535091 RepID=UPI00115BD86F|nr:hypothetical protein [Campylobacter sp. MIT 99-7217]TQR31793.1 hypothetical protein DMB92_05240 [Campylobacter sp. MIT 99-7217]